MGKALIIAEKPSVAREIAAVLGGCVAGANGALENDEVVVSNAVGHLVTIECVEAETTGKDFSTLPIIPEAFSLKTIDKSRAQYNVLETLMARPDIDVIINACDAGREGELIFRLIYEKARCRKPMQRMWLQSMTSESIRTAYADRRPGHEFDALNDAARCRSESDWLIGVNGTRGLTSLRKAQTGVFEIMACGRVQTPTLALPVRRELEIRHFVPKDYWEVQGTFRTAVGPYLAKWFSPKADPAALSESEQAEAEAREEAGEAPCVEGNRFFNKAEADAVVARTHGRHPDRVTDESKSSLSHPPALFDLTTLQRVAIRRFKFSAKKVLDLAQSLYDAKVTSYPRTDATALPEDYLDTAKTILSSLSDPAYAPHATRILDNGWVRPNKAIFDNSKITDHFAIIPTGVRPGKLSDDEQKIFDLITRRFLAVFHPAAEYRNTVRLTVIGEDHFKASGRVLVTPGWQVVMGEGGDGSKAPSLVSMTPGEAVKTDRIVAQGLKTTPPSRYTEDTLLGAMETAGKFVSDPALRQALKARGLGTPATRAATIEGLLFAKAGGEAYLMREKGYLVPSSKAISLITFLDSSGISMLTSPAMTGEWEQKLLQMAKGEYRRADFMREIAQETRQMLDVMRGKVGQSGSLGEKVAIVMLPVACPKCKADGIEAGPRAYRCPAAGCGFSLYRDICKRDLTPAEAKTLLTVGALDPVDGFVSPNNGKKFSAGLVINKETWRADFVFAEREPGAASGSAPSGPALPVLCPKCGGDLFARGDNLVACGSGDFKLYREICKKRLTDKQVVTLCETGKIAKVTDFVSPKSGFKFDAGLAFNADYSKVEFVFAERAR